MPPGIGYNEEDERLRRQRGFGGAISGAGAGAAIGSAIPGVGTAIGGAIGAGLGLFGGGQPVQQPFTIPPQKPNAALKSAYGAAIFGNQGNYNPNALLPTGGSPGFQYQPPQQSQYDAAFGGGGIQRDLTPRIARNENFNPKGFNQVDQNLPARGYIDTITGAVNPRGNPAGLDRSTQAAIDAGYDPFQDQLNLQSAGTANLGLGFQNVQNAQEAAGGLISQGANIAAQGNQNFLTNEEALRSTIGQNAGQFQDFFGGLQNNLTAANDFTNQAAGFADFSPESIAQARRLGGTAETLAGGTLSDQDLAREILLQDRDQRAGLINQGIGTQIDPTTQAIIDNIRNSTLQSFESSLVDGPLAGELDRRFATAQNNAAARGLGVGSSPVLQAGVEVEKERARLLDDATNRANLAANQAALDVRGQQQQAGLQAAGLLNQSAISSQGQLPALTSAGASAVNAGSGAVNAATNAQRAGADILSQAAQNQIAQNQAGVQQGNLLLAGQGQEQAALQNLLNSAIQNTQTQTGAASSLAGQALGAGGLGVQQGQLGLQTQGQGYDQILAMLQALQQQNNNKFNRQAARAASEVGASFGGSR